MQRVAVVDGRHDLEAVVPEQAGETVAQEREILGDHDPHGSSTRTIVGPPSGLYDVQGPVERLGSLAEPGQAGPGPIRSALSVVLDLRNEHPAARWMRMSTCSARACLVAFASASATVK